MKSDLEQDLKDLFTEMVADEPPLGAPLEARTSQTPARGSSWTFNVHSALRGALARGFATAGLAGAVAVGAVVAPRIVEERRPTHERTDGTTIVPSKRPTPSRGGPVAIAPPRSGETKDPATTPGTAPTVDPTTGSAVNVDPGPGATAEPTREPDPTTAETRPTTEPTREPTREPTPPPPPASNCSTGGYGSIQTASPCDAAMEAILRFAGARIEFRNADIWLASGAQGQYDRHETGLWLYAPATERAYEKYVITGRQDGSDGVRFTVEMHQGYGSRNADRLRIEYITIGSSVNHRGNATPNGMAVVHAKLIAGPSTQ